MKKPKIFRPVKAVASRVYNGRAHIDALYKGEWESYSLQFLSVNTRCYSCGRKSQATDHIQVHNGNWELFHERENHMPLCYRCHNYITGKFDRRLPQELTQKLSWVAMQRRRNSVSFPVKIIPWKWNRKQKI